MKTDTQENKTLTDSKFMSKGGVEMSVKDVVSEKECWYIEKEKRWVLAHRAVQKIAALAGISKNYQVEESTTVQPTYKNELEHIVRVTITCMARTGKTRRSKGCIHDPLDYKLTVTGEANKLNTPVRGRGYLRKMAEKRAFDVAVLEHLDLYDTTFSEEESETMLGRSPVGSQAVEISNVDLEALSDEVNMLLDCDTKAKLEKVMKIIKERNESGAYSALQATFLEHMRADRYTSIVGADENPDDKPF